MGGGGRYPYPKHVWSPAGGWWSQPANWKMNTFILSCGIAVACGAIVRGVAHREAELAGEPLERRRITTIWREYLHNRTRATNLAPAEALKSGQKGSAKE
ncbi:hypothetical protein DFH07DRAFT_790110 [Mycena maculata]|uniref:Uncharacterized protein n=1 Tax=Mycena maculata TaxID=230809 RepID=A0AAD7KB98_9AGAR|nr:hypothetical protein DFH07DRAFT_790110 [Mycena maculata]